MGRELLETEQEKMRSVEAMLIIMSEYLDATKIFPRFNSAHEGYAVILEELDELKKEVWRKPGDRCPGVMLKEAKQVGAMAVRFIVDVALPALEEERRRSAPQEMLDCDREVERLSTIIKEAFSLLMVDGPNTYAVKDILSRLYYRPKP